MILAGRYEIMRPLAEGGFGKTYLARDRHLPGTPTCVIKHLQQQNFTADTLQTAQRLFDLEAKTLYQLGTHVQIPTLLAHFEQDGEFYLVQEYIEGQSLEQEFAQSAKTFWQDSVHRRVEQPEEQGSEQGNEQERAAYTFTLLQDLLTVLAFVHQHGVVHRDIKPTNIIRRESDSKIVLIDFGSVKPLSPNAQTVSIGSPGYIAPEQQAGRPCLASDLYSVGIIALESLTGKSHKQLPTDPVTGHLSIKQIAEFNQFNPLTLFIKRLVAVEARDRFPTATAALQALNHSSSLEPIPEHSSSSEIAPTTLPPTPLDLSPTPLQPTHSSFRLPPSAFFPTSHPFQRTATQARNRQALLNKVHRFWIQGVLEHSLHGQLLLTLGLEERNQALSLPWNLSYETAQQPSRPLDSGTRIFDIFQQLGEGRSLLILGEPGAGKTTTLLTLARDLLEKRALEASRIPAIFNLSSWMGEPIEQWLVLELSSKYQIPQAIGRTWVNDQQLLFLLDGLDEVRADRQDSCAAAINQFHREYGPEIVVCCRIKDYERLASRLSFQCAVCVRSLTNAQIWQYLDKSATGLTGLRSLLERNSEADADNQHLLELARSPLILNIMALTYQGLSANDIPALTQGESYTHQLFGAYITRMFQRREIPSPYSPQQTVRWLSALAKNLVSTSQTVFLIERMQVNWLHSKRQRLAYGILVWFSFILIATTIGWHVINRRSLPFAIVIGGLICVKIFGLYRIVPAEKLQWSWLKARRALRLGLTFGPLIGLALKLVFAHISNPNLCRGELSCFLSLSYIGLSFGTVLGITYGIIGGLRGNRIAIVTRPNQGIRQSARNAVMLSIVATVAPFLISFLFRGETSSAFWAAAGLSFGLALGGGEACVKHVVLRFVLFCQGRVPWNYARFLDYAAERIFLQKVGGGYIFIHRLLLEHFSHLSEEK
ncbi:MAG: protein kinase [Cyanobacteria bacterium P01_D01_bin.1]